jgi:hypothetical protein
VHLRMARGRLQASIVLGLSVSMCVVGFVSGAPALAASGSVSQLRRAFSQTVLALRVTGNAAVCSSTTREGRIALTEILQGEERYLPSTTCTEAFAGRVAAKQANPLYGCDSVEPTISQAIIHVRGDRATIKLTYDSLCLLGDVGTEYLTGASAVAADPIGTSHWMRKHGRWLFDNRPTGTYSRAGRKAVVMLRAALSARTVTWPESFPGAGTVRLPLCTNGTTQPVFSHNGETAVAPPVFWYVAAGLTSSDQHEPPFDAQGDPQGAVFVPTFSAAEWDVKVVGGVPVATSPPNLALPVSTPGAAGC